MAVTLGVALSGPRSYGGTLRHEPCVNPEGRNDPGPEDIDRAVQALWRVWAAVLALVIVIALVD
jgi:adenosylcobinamide-phosphate synthase